MPNSSTSQPTPARKSYGGAAAPALKTWARRLGWLVLAVLLLWLITYLAVPPIAKWQLQKLASDKLGRQVTIGKIDFKPWSLELTVEDLNIAMAGNPPAPRTGEPTPAAQLPASAPVSPPKEPVSPPGANSVTGTPSTTTATVPAPAPARATQATALALPQSSQLFIRRIYMDAELQSLLRLAPVVDAITIEAPAMRVTHLGSGRYDIDDIIARLRPAAGEAEKPASQPPQFALYNLALTGGSVDFTDQTLRTGATTHTLRDLAINVPFLSNLQSQREIKTEPRLAFNLNGSTFDTAAASTPFAQTRKTDATLKIERLDLAPYLGYLPTTLPVRLQGAVLNANVTIAFEQAATTALKLTGTVTADKARLLDAHGPLASPTQTPAQAGRHDLLAFERLAITLADVRPLEQRVHLASVELTAPVLQVRRDRSGQFNLISPAPAPAPATKTVAASARESSAKSDKSTQTPAASPTPDTPWNITIDSVRVRSGRANWIDESVGAAPLALHNLELEASSIQLPFTASAPLQFKGALGLDAATVAQAAPASPAPASRANTRAGNTRAGKTQVGKARQASSAEVAAATPPAPPANATLQFSGTATDQAAKVTATASNWPLTVARNYVKAFLQPTLDGRLDAQLGIDWQAAKAGQPQKLAISAPQFTLQGVQLTQDKTSLASIDKLAWAGVEIDLERQAVKAGKLHITQLETKVERDAQKRWMFESWLVPPAKPHAKADADAAVEQTRERTKEKIKEAANQAKAGWAVAIDDLALDGGTVGFIDRAASKPVAFEVTALKAQLAQFTIGGPPATGKASLVKALMPLTVAFKLNAGRFEPGTLDFKGKLGLEPLQAAGQLTASRLPVQAFEPYFAESLNIALLRADAGFKGQVAFRQTPTGPFAQATGDVSVEDFRSNTLAPSEELLTWKSLNLRGLALALDPGQATRIDVRETVLADFFARVIVTPEGRINLQDLVRPPGQGAAASNAGVATKKIAGGARVTSAKRPKASQNERDIDLNIDIKQADAVAAPQAVAPPPARTGPAPIINFGPISLVSGRVLFSDRFVKPNYTANLSELTGKLSAFSSRAQPQAGAAATFDMADLELRGRAESTASLEIVGKLNPLADPLALDITGKVRDLELPPLSPYAIKYAGYGINRGKMSLDVNYVVQPDGLLTAKNKLVLNQLSFGDKVEGAPASLPVKLAVALLADRNGVIDLDLPISGSLNDPQFSLGPLIGKVIINVIGKAITSPFSLLGSAFGSASSGAGGAGADETSNVKFAAGSAQLTPEATASLDKIAKALTERPALKLTVIGTSSLAAEREALQRVRLDERVRAEKRRATAKNGSAGSNETSSERRGEITVSPAEYPALLKAVYERADFAKPRNAIGLTKDLPEAEMEKLLLADIEVTDESMRELAVQRGVAVRDYLAAAKLPAERLFLGAVKTTNAASSPTSNSDSKWSPRAELDLAAR